MARAKFVIRIITNKLMIFFLNDNTNIAQRDVQKIFDDELELSSLNKPLDSWDPTSLLLSLGV